MLLDPLFIHSVQRFARQLEVLDKRITPAPGEIFPHDHPHQLQFLAMWRHCIRRHHPAPLPQLMRNRKFIVLMPLLRIESKGHQRQSFAVSLGHDDEAELFQAGSEVVGGVGKIVHDGAVAALSKADHLVVLADDLGGAFGEVEREGGLVGAEIVDVEDEFFGKVSR